MYCNNGSIEVFLLLLFHLLPVPFRNLSVGSCQDVERHRVHEFVVGRLVSLAELVAARIQIREDDVANLVHLGLGFGNALLNEQKEVSEHCGQRAVVLYLENAVRVHLFVVI